MINKKSIVVSVLAIIGLAGCATESLIAPQIAVMPAPGKPFEVFQQEEQLCRNYAQSWLNQTPAERGGEDLASGALVGAGIGALAGTMIGGGSHTSVGTGAGIGLIGGALAGLARGGSDNASAQQSFDTSYVQCMYAKGNQVPGYTRYLPPLY